MPKKRSKPRKPRPSVRGGPHRLRPARPPAAELAGLRGAFLAWLRGYGLPVHIDPAALWDDAVTTVNLAAARTGLIDLHAWTAEQVDTLAADGDEADALAVLPLPRCTAGGRRRTARGLRRRVGLDRQGPGSARPPPSRALHIRDWSGLRDGETLDPDAFDLTEVDERLAGLRRSAAVRGHSRSAAVPLLVRSGTAHAAGRRHALGRTAVLTVHWLAETVDAT
jgi:hypothetical protein